MNFIETVVDLSSFPIEERAAKILELIEKNRHLIIKIHVNHDGSKRLWFNHYRVTGQSHIFDQNAFHPIKLQDENSKEDVSAFLEKIIRETGQEMFQIDGDGSTVSDKSLVRKIATSKIDYPATIAAVYDKVVTEESNNSDYDKVWINAIEGVKYNKVRVDSLPHNPGNRHIEKCRKHLLRVYFYAHKKKQRPIRQVRLNKTSVY